MKNKFILQNLECANCAAKMEDMISKIDGVGSVSINYMTRKMILEADRDNMTIIIEESQKIISKFEPGTKLIKA